MSSLSGSVKLCGLSSGQRSFSGGKTGRRTWFEQEETAASKRSSASATMAEASMVQWLTRCAVCSNVRGLNSYWSRDTSLQSEE